MTVDVGSRTIAPKSNDDSPNYFQPNEIPAAQIKPSPTPNRTSERSKNMRGRIILFVAIGLVVLVAIAASGTRNTSRPTSQFLGSAENNSAQLIQQGREIFRFDTFGDEAFRGGQLQLHQAINTLTPRNALALGLKVDAEALSPSVVEAIKHGKINLDDPSVTRTLIQQKAVLGVVGFFDNNNTLRSVGLTCAVCHWTTQSHPALAQGSTA
jgi:hypothetical protein